MTALDEYVAHFQARVLQSAWQEATRTWWLRRAEQFEAARPRRGDYNGQATPADRTARWEHLTETAAACRARAQLTDLSDVELGDAFESYATTLPEDAA